MVSLYFVLVALKNKCGILLMEATQDGWWPQALSFPDEPLQKHIPTNPFCHIDAKGAS
jgi:hypothetical protein